MKTQVGDTYRHFKGAKYKVIAIATDSEDANRQLVIYQNTTTGSTWAREIGNFEGLHESGVKRFQKC
jgi:hypothetical protein